MLVGVFRSRLTPRSCWPWSCPHARGGVPIGLDEMDALSQALSPCSWGCSGTHVYRYLSQPRVVPMLVGVFREMFGDRATVPLGCPHARGGVPPDVPNPLVFGECCPHARGGVPPE